MYIFTNAAKNLLRNKGRNILMGLVTLAIIISAVVALTINNASSRIIEDARLDIASRVDISVDLFTHGRDGRESITVEQYISFADSQYLRHTIYHAEMQAWFGNFYAIGDLDLGTAPPPDPNMAHAPIGRLVGNSEPENLAGFGTYRHLVEGRMYAALNEAIITEELAALNQLSIGDIIYIESAFQAGKAFELEIVGIFSHEPDPMEEWQAGIWAMMGFSLPMMISHNEVITSFETLMTAGWQTAEGLDMRLQYYLRNPDYLPRFEREVRAKGLPDVFGVTINQAALDRVTGPLSSMRNAAMTFTIVILVLGAIVLVLISYLAIRERKYEVGVLRAMGMARGKISLGIFTEAIIITTLCLAIGLGLGGLTAQPVASRLLAGEVESAVEAAQASGEGGRVLIAGGEVQTDDPASGYRPISDIEAAIGAGVIAQIIIIALALAAISSIIGIIRITQYEPLKILRDRN
ncbi:MAG: ABC transporter permease [Defluviitaleaceae bacterium]|nr:ABC transporter permease [Defluviitaleaceae bacterium]